MVVIQLDILLLLFKTNMSLIIDQQTRVLNDLDEKFHNMAELAIEDPSLGKVIDNQAPIDAYRVYKNVIDNLQIDLLAISEIIHKFIHEDSDKLKMIPMCEDLELIYYSVALIISYLARRL